jgi:hypothetical protein
MASLSLHIVKLHLVLMFTIRNPFKEVFLNKEYIKYQICFGNVDIFLVNFFQKVGLLLYNTYIYTYTYIFYIFFNYDSFNYFHSMIGIEKWNTCRKLLFLWENRLLIPLPISAADISDMF